MKSRFLLSSAIVMVVGAAFSTASVARAGDLTEKQFRQRLNEFLKSEKHDKVKSLADKVKVKMNVDHVNYDGKSVTWNAPEPVKKADAESYLKEVVYVGLVGAQGLTKEEFAELKFVVNSPASPPGGQTKTENIGPPAGRSTTSSTTGTVVSESGCRGCGLFGRLFHRCR